MRGDQTMWIYSSTLAMGVVSLLSLLAVLWLAGGQNPFVTLWRAAGYLFRQPRALALVALAYTMVPFNLLIERLEAAMAIDWDFTGSVARFGTGFLLFLQRWEWAPITHLLTYVYVILFPMLMLGAMMFYAWRQDFGALKNHVISYWLNYAVALPFYLWVPVNEAWTWNAGIRFLIPTVFPGFDQVVRPHSGLDNSIPSLHTSLAVTYALVAWRQGYRRLAVVLGINALLVMLSTVYLGVHWLLDLLSGIALGVLASGYLTLPSPATAERGLRTSA